MSRSRVILSAVLAAVIVLLAIAWLYPARSREASYPLRAPAFPTPPQQSAPFAATAPNPLADTFASAADALFSAGFPDPRGCSYAQVTIHVGDVWQGDAGTLTTHAFLLPDVPASDAKTPPHFAIAWNGLIYPVEAIGPAADVKADIAALLDEDKKQNEKELAEHPEAPHFRRVFADRHEGATFSDRSVLRTKALLLYRLGEPALAQRILDAYQVDHDISAVAASDPFYSLAGDWLWYRFERAVTAHMRADDRLSWMDASLLTTLGPTLEKACEDRHVLRPNDFGNHKSPMPFFPFLEPVPRLLADEARRNAAPVDLSSPLPASESKRIAVLITRLEEVSARQMSQPGCVNLDEDPIVQTLSREGTAAVKPLINCLRSDKRLTRSVGFGRDFHRDRTLLSVPSAALACLREILQHPFELDDSLPREQAIDKVIGEIEATAASYKPGKLESRAFDQLANDAASADDWTNAAIILALAENWKVSLGQHAPGSGIVTPSSPPSLSPKPRLIGESLRLRKAPSVGDLLAKRLKQVGSSEYYRNAFFIAKALAAWDGKGHLADLRDFCDTVAPLTNDRDYEIQSIVPFVGELFADRIALKDPQAPAKYAQWIRSVPRRKVSFDSLQAFYPMALAPDDPDIQAAATALFDTPGTDWNPTLRSWAGGPDFGEKNVDSPMLRVPAFRRQIIRELSDSTPIGSTTVGPDGKPHRMLGKIPAPGAGKETPYPISNFCAWQLSLVMGFPHWDDSLPETDKEILRKRFSDCVEQYGPNVTYVCEHHLIDLKAATPVVSFPKLDHPASEQDVAAHRAIFCLPQETDPTQVSMNFPMKASWSKCPGRELQTSGPKPFIDRSGLIWQAEECTEKGVKKRYYGFVGYGCIAKVPADEIEPEK